MFRSIHRPHGGGRVLFGTLSQFQHGLASRGGVFMAEEETVDVPVDDLIPFVNQSREQFEDEPLIHLSESIKTHGLLQSGVAWHDAGRGKYVLICGERRWRAIKLAGQPTMKVKVLAGPLTPGQMLALNLSENLQRETLTVIEKSAGLPAACPERKSQRKSHR